MRASSLLAVCAVAGPAACLMILPVTWFTGNPVPVAAGVFLALFLLWAVACCTEVAHLETTPSERIRWAEGAHFFSVTTRFNLVSSVLLTLLALAFALFHSAWALMPLLAVSCGAAALARAHLRREGAARREAAAEPVLTGPKVIGLRGPEQVPQGWVPVVVHRPRAGMRDMLVDYRVHVDGDRVGTVAPGESLVVGLPPGPHSARCAYAGFSSAPVSFVAAPGVPVHLVGEPGGTAAAAAADQRKRPQEYIRLSRVPG
ncbi:hypothetical protein ACIRPH_28025 [Nocardiopsis sp. NPDC101807]|uniref:hypothetical protein n=1 Tax=Nocardiopsis sp. NPDC101807 TaxID=3364339 RepID=UPI003825376A